MTNPYFNSSSVLVPKTQAIKYAGSKLKMLPHILDIIKDLEIKTVLDGFSGSTRVSQFFNQLGYQTTSNDISAYSEVLSQCFLLNTDTPAFYQPYIDQLNNLQPISGWFSKYYGGSDTDTKKPFRLKNTMKLDAIRPHIDTFDLSITQKSVLITSLLLALDKVDSTLGHFASYLKDWSIRSNKELWLEVPDLVINNGLNRVCRQDIFQLAQSDSWDLVYYDPPYGSNNAKMPPSRVRYQAYYHFWSSVVLNDQPDIFGNVGRRVDTRDSVSSGVFEEFRTDDNNQFLAITAVENLIKSTNSRYILLSYNSGNPKTQKQLLQFLSTQNVIKTIAIDYQKNVMSTMTSTRQWLPDETKYQEYLFLIDSIFDATK